MTGARAISLVLLCAPLLGSGDVMPPSIEIMPHWKKGDTFNLTIARAREKSLDGKSTLSGKTQTRFTIEVLHANDEGYLIGWTAGETTFEAPAPSESFLRQVVGLMQGLQIVLQINPRGTITGVQNWKELRDKTLKVMDDALANTPDSQQGARDKSLLSDLRAQWETSFATKEQVEQMSTRDARVYFMVLGRGYTSTVPYEYTDHVPNPLGGEPFPTRATITLKRFDARSRQAVLTWSQTADPQQAARILESMVKDLAARRGKALPDGVFAKSISMEDNADIAIDVGTGWVKSLMLTRSVNLGTRSQIDTTTFVKSVKGT